MAEHDSGCAWELRVRSVRRPRCPQLVRHKENRPRRSLQLPNSAQSLSEQADHPSSTYPQIGAPAPPDHYFDHIE